MNDYVTIMQVISWANNDCPVDIGSVARVYDEDHLGEKDVPTSVTQVAESFGQGVVMLPDGSIRSVFCFLDNFGMMVNIHPTFDFVEAITQVNQSPQFCEQLKRYRSQQAVEAGWSFFTRGW